MWRANENIYEEGAKIENKNKSQKSQPKVRSGKIVCRFPYLHTESGNTISTCIPRVAIRLKFEVKKKINK